MNEPIFLLLDQVMALHARQLDVHGGQAGVRDPGLLESAVATPQASFGGDFLHEDLCAMAAAYAFHIAENQPFVDGNKRAAMGAALVFLRLNGLRVPPSDILLHDAMIGIAERRMKKDDLAALFRSVIEPA